MTIEGKVPYKEFAGTGEVIAHDGKGVTIVPGKGEVCITIGEGVTAEIFSRHRVGTYLIYDFRERADEQIPHHAGALIATPWRKRIRVPTRDYPEGQFFKVEGLGEWMWTRASERKTRKKRKSAVPAL